MINVIVTGSNGFVGRNIVRDLRELGYRIIGIGTKNDTAIEIDEYCCWDIGHEVIPEKLKNEKADIIIHAAACLDKNDDSEELIFTNCIGTYRIYELAKILHVTKVILLSSIPIIGYSKGKIDEKSLVNPLSMYHATKAAQEYILNQLNKLEIKVINLRIPSPIGKDMPLKSIVPIFAKNALDGKDIRVKGKGNRRQNYIDVRDISTAIYLIIKAKSANGVYNIGAKRSVSNIELAKICKEAACSNSNIIFDGIDDQEDIVWDVNSDKIRKELNFENKYSIQNSVADIITFLRQRDDD